ncbi:MAG: efflux RND transporter periplasmic adaptor subunit [Pseudomonadota bacterium]
MRDSELSDLILASMTDGVVNVDGQGRLTRVNPAAQRILGLDPDIALGQPYAAIFFGPAENDEFNQLLLDLVSTQEERPYAEVPFRRADGALLQLATTTFRLRHPDDPQRIVGAVVVFKDITTLHNLRRQRDELAGELKQKHEELKQAYIETRERNRVLNEAQRRLLWIKLAAGALAVLFFAWLALGIDWQAPSGMAGSGGEQIDQADLLAALPAGAGSLRRFAVRLGDVIHSVPASGFVEPVELVAVCAAVAGRVEARPVKLGDAVSQGQLLVALDPGEVLPLVRRAQADLLKAQAQVNELENWAQRPEFAQARRAVEMAGLHLEQEERRHSESEALFAKGIISREEMDRGRAAHRRAQFDLAESQERLGLARERGGPDKLKVARLELANAEAALAEAREKERGTSIAAPIAGVVMRPRRQDNKREAGLPEVGAQVQAGQELFSLGAVQPLGVQVQVPEAVIAGLKPGQKALVAVEALGGRVLSGEVRSVAPQAQRDQGAAVFPVLVVLDTVPEPLRQRLRLGMSASVRIVVEERRGVPLVPVVAVLETASGAAVRLAAGEAAQVRPVRTGLADREFVEISEGLKPGDTVLY